MHDWHGPEGLPAAYPAESPGGGGSLELPEMGFPCLMPQKPP